MSWFVLGTVSLGTLYMLFSVAVTIYRWRHAVPLGSPISDVASHDELESCLEELTDVSRGLAKHLKDSSRILGNYADDQRSEVQRWYEDRSFWLGQWTALGRRCRFDAHREGTNAKVWEELGVAHDELKEIEATYTAELMRFGREQTPRLQRVSERLNKIRRAPAPTRDTPERSAGAIDSEKR